MERSSPVPKISTEHAAIFHIMAACDEYGDALFLLSSSAPYQRQYTKQTNREQRKCRWFRNHLSRDDIAWFFDAKPAYARKYFSLMFSYLTKSVKKPISLFSLILGND